MFVVQAISPFSALIMSQGMTQNQEVQNSSEKQQQQDEQNLQQSSKRKRSPSQERQLLGLGTVLQKTQQNPDKGVHLQKKQQPQNCQHQQIITYLTFQTEDKILVRQTFDSGWWYGNTLKDPTIKGYFPSTFVRVGGKPQPPPPPSSKPPQQGTDVKVYDPRQGDNGEDWMEKEFAQVQIPGGPVKSQYYSVIKGYKMVKIDEKNQNILKGNHVKFDVATGMASVPIKDQAPTAKAVRQMGYYFDYHQWNEEKNKNPLKKARPDAKKKKKKKLNLKFMD